MVTPIVDGVETSGFYSLELPEEIKTNYKDMIESGDLFVTAQGATIQADSVTLAENAMISVLEHPPIARRKLAVTGKRTVIVLRITMSSGEKVVYPASQIEDHLFVKEIGLKKHMAKCTNGAVDMENLGVFEITVPGKVADYASAGDIRNKALQVFATQKGVGNAGDLADHIMAIVPENNFPGFVGNAATRGWISTLNNNWSLDVMVYMHEIGHNFGLGHAYLTNNVGDFTSLMSSTGYTPRLDGPIKCYNGASNREMGWFGSRARTVNLNNDPTQLIDLAAIGEADKPDTTDPILLEVGSYSVQYNAATGYNSGTEMLRDRVLVSYSYPAHGDTIVEKDGLLPGSPMFEVNNFDGSGKTLRIAACEVLAGSSSKPSAMKVGITLNVAGSPCDVIQDTPATTAAPPTTTTTATTTTTTTTTTPTTTTTTPATTTTTPTTTTPAINNICPDTSKLKAKVSSTNRRGQTKTVNFKCAQLGKKARLARRWCKQPTANGIFQKVWDVCLQECAFLSKQCQAA